MDLKKRVSISWSGGKDSALALYKISLNRNYRVESLHTVIGKDTGRVGMHGVREELIEQQAKAIGLPLEKIYLESSQEHAAYEACMLEFYTKSAHQLDAIVFGDIYLEDLKEYREKLLKQSGIKGLYPLWQMDSRLLIQDFLNTGFKTVICSCNEELNALKLLGKVLNENIVQQLPDTVDPCGERGEFHTFVFDGPVFNRPVEFNAGHSVSKTYSYQTVNEAGMTQEATSVMWFQDFLALIAP